MYLWILSLLAGASEKGGLRGSDVASPTINESSSIALEYDAAALPLLSIYSSTWDKGKTYLGKSSKAGV